VRVAVAELLVAVQVKVLFTSTASDGFEDDSTTVSNPSDEVAVTGFNQWPTGWCKSYGILASCPAEI
jgi:hypothetical protein